jgi:hypothetical protein
MGIVLQYGPPLNFKYTTLTGSSRHGVRLSSTFQNTPQLCCGDEIFLRGLIARRMVLDLFLLKLVQNIGKDLV